MEPQPQQEKIRPPAWRRVWRVARVLLVLGIVAALVLYADPAELWRALKSANYLLVLAGLPIMLAAMVCDSLKVFLLMRPHGYRSGWAYVFRTVLIVNFASAFLPGTVGGGVITWYRLARPEGQRAQAFTAVSMNTAIKLIVILSLGACGAAIYSRSAEVDPLLVWVLAAGAALPLFGLALMLWTPLPIRVREWFSARLETRLPGRVGAGLRKILESLETYQRARPAVLGAFVMGCARRLIEVGAILLYVRAVGVEEIGYLPLLWIACIAEAVGMLPLSPSGFGLAQAGFVGMLVAVGVGPDKALAANLVSYVVLLIIYMTGGLLLMQEWALDRRSKR